ncbi:hypothetical protein NEMIN01_0141 [Nematocida minor]|uniref:uncharacterized protein n=1 Tax=Nematocida minor TaxID=1912983 RepID=UPI002220FF89|nr:uncharacterized protein NEMIN01_0037 [Nematocida minor]XP_051332043.1 uncharacterized protein NEMIN01_0141 [Nematocida minor]KAI5188773.1 hypothetical protein NEMIN01_0037 [Nematocida minor]KAI5188877.1 hypothetical protein NEMIN01_0141 [Nematocida minor]
MVLRSFLAEGLCTFLFAYAVYAVITGVNITPGDEGIANIAVTLTIALTSVSIIYAFMDITIAHFNPAITLAAIVTGKLPIWMGLGYIIMQCAGAMLGSAAMLLTKPGTSSELLGYTRSTLSPNADIGEAILTEMILTGALTYVAFSVAINVFNPPTQVKIEIPDEVEDNDKLRVVTSQAPNRSAFAPIAIGFTLGFLSLLGIGSSGGVFNPAITLPPVLFSGVWVNCWVYWVGQFVGGIVGALLHVIIFAKSV